MRKMCVLFVAIVMQASCIIAMQTDEPQVLHRYGTFKLPSKISKGTASSLSLLWKEFLVKIKQGASNDDYDVEFELQEVKLEEYTAMIKIAKCNLYYRPTDIISIQVHNAGFGVTVLCKDNRKLGFDTEELEGDYLWTDDSDGKALVDKGSGKLILEW